jgi:hypothetical protein
LEILKTRNTHINMLKRIIEYAKVKEVAQGALDILKKRYVNR